MPIPSREKVRRIARILQFAPVAAVFFVALSYWWKGSIEVAVIFGLMSLGLLLLIYLIHSIK